jgi:heat shock protein HslJ
VKKYLLILIMICLTVSGCAAKENALPLAGSWRLTAYGPSNSPTPAVPDVEAILNFDADGTLTGNTGCNQLGGDYQVEGDQITFGQIVSTLIGCPDLEMAQEDSMHQVLTGTASFKIEGNTLTITNNNMVLVFESVAGAA